MRWSQLARKHFTTGIVVLAGVAAWRWAGSPVGFLVVVAGAWAWGVYSWCWDRRKATVKAGLPVPAGWRLVVDYVKFRVARARLERSWRTACEAYKLTAGRKDNTPVLLGVNATLDGDLSAWTGCGAIGVPVDAVQKQVDNIAQTVGCREVVLTPTRSGRAQITFYWSDPLGRILTLGDLPTSPAGMVSIGVSRDGQPVTIRADLSVIVGGMTGFGKSNVVEAGMSDLNRSGEWVDYYISDPKGGIELQQFAEHVGVQNHRMRVRQYVTTAAETLKMVEDVEKAMRSRMRTQVGKTFVPGPDNPRVIVLLDEFLPLHEMIRQGTKGKLGQILFEGRAAGFTVWANTQIGHASELGTLRNLIPQRVCFATKTAETTDTILGTGAEARGAKCSQIRTPGVFFLESDGSRYPVNGRAPLVTEDDMLRIAAGEVPEGMAKAGVRRSERCAVYRLYGWPDPDDGSRELVYIGKAVEPADRIKQHERDHARGAGKEWWPEIDPTATVVKWHPTEGKALAAEEAAIKAEWPRENDLHNGANPIGKPSRFRLLRGGRAA